MPRTVIDCDQHLYESRTLWADHIDPRHRDEALAIVDDDLGYSWLTWRGRRLELADVQLPGRPALLGAHRNRQRDGVASEYSYDEALPDDYWEPGARVSRLEAMGVDAAVLFPNFGLLWERKLSASLPALTANMTAWNRWCTTVAAAGGGHLHPVAHLTLRDASWAEAQLEMLGAAGVRLAMIAAAPVDGRPLSHPDHDRIWAAFVEHGVAPTFHVADQPRAFADGWYAGPEEFASPLDSVMLSTPVQLAITDLVINGTLTRHPDLRVGVVELGATWVPLYLMLLDGAWEFTARLNGRRPAPLDGLPSDHVRRQVRVAAFSYEQPARLAEQAGEVFMMCSDYPHGEGTAAPLADYAATGLDASSAPALFHDNVAFLLGGTRAPVTRPAVADDVGWFAAQQRRRHVVGDAPGRG